MLTATAALPTSPTPTWNNPPTTVALWNAADISGVTLSGGNLTATATGAGGVRENMGLSSGKYYWETTLGTWTNTNTNVGIASATAVLSSVAGSASQAVFIFRNGDIWVNGGNSGVNLGIRASGDTMGIALDVGAQLIWFRVAPSGNWNGNAGYAPGGTGGIGVSALTGSLYPLFSSNTAGEAVTANFGASGFSGSVPAGFTSGIPNISSVKQHLSVTFTAQTAGRLRGLVRLGKPSTTLWLNPQITVT